LAWSRCPPDLWATLGMMAEAALAAQADLIGLAAAWDYLGPA